MALDSGNWRSDGDVKWPARQQRRRVAGKRRTEAARACSSKKNVCVFCRWRRTKNRAATELGWGSKPADGDGGCVGGLVSAEQGRRVGGVFVVVFEGEAESGELSWGFWELGFHFGGVVACWFSFIPQYIGV